MSCVIPPAELLLSAGGDACRRLAVLRELRDLAGQYRKSAGPGEEVSSGKPWRIFMKTVGRACFLELLRVVRFSPPCEERALAGDIMALLGHPSAIGRLLERYECGVASVSVRPPLEIYRGLGEIGTGGAVRALISLWGTKWDADVVAALSMCNSGVAQDFLMRQSREHAKAYIRFMCLASLRAPLTESKEALLLDRLRHGTHDERFVAIMKIEELKATRAIPELLALRAADISGHFSGLIKEAVSMLRAASATVG